MDRFIIDLSIFGFGLVLGFVMTVSDESLSLVQVMKSGDQYQVRYNKQNYLLVPCNQTQCK